MSNLNMIDKFICVVDKFTLYIDKQTQFAETQTKIIHSLYEKMLKDCHPELYESIKNSKKL